MSEEDRELDMRARAARDRDLANVTRRADTAEEEARTAQNKYMEARERAEAEAKEATTARAKVYTENTPI